MFSVRCSFRMKGRLAEQQQRSYGCEAEPLQTQQRKWDNDRQRMPRAQLRRENRWEWEKVNASGRAGNIDCSPSVSLRVHWLKLAGYWECIFSPRSGGAVCSASASPSQTRSFGPLTRSNALRAGAQRDTAAATAAR